MTQACRICRNFPAAHKKIWKNFPTFRNLRVRISFYKKMYVKENNSVLFSIHEFFIKWIRQSCKRLVLFLFILFSRRSNPMVMVPLLLLAVLFDWWLMTWALSTSMVDTVQIFCESTSVYLWFLTDWSILMILTLHWQKLELISECFFENWFK
jgi:hypothetical protein